MKKLLLFGLSLLFVAEIYSQATFNTGGIRVDVNKYGRVRIYTAADVQQLERASILVGTSPTDVFDYTNDAESVDPTILVTSPTQSDFEIYGSYDNSYSALPPDVLEKLNVYSWTNQAYAIFRYNIKNSGTTAYNATMGLDMIPYLNETYGFDTVTYNATENVIRFHRGTGINLGVKLLSASLTSLYSFEWFDGYSVDTSYWNWMHYGSLQPQYASNTADGPVAITAQAPIAMDPSATTNVYYAMALGTDEATMLANINAAVAKYQILITGVEDSKLADGFTLGKNAPNPFKQSTVIRYQLPGEGQVTLKVYDMMGNEVAALVNETQSRGSHQVDFTANELPGGVYTYTLRFNDQVKTNKMVLVK